MKNLYKITKNQLKALLVFGLVGFIAAIGKTEDSGIAIFFAILIPAALIFYTIGWRDANKDEGKIIEIRLDKEKFIPSKKPLKRIGLGLMIILVLTGIVLGSVLLINKKRDKLKYNQALLKIDLVREKAVKCVQPFFDKEYQEELRSCNMLKDKVRHDYNFCVSLDYIESPASCIYKNDYKAIDCSEEVIKKKAISNVVTYNPPAVCRSAMDEFEETNGIINEHSK